MTTGKTIVLTRGTFIGKLIYLLFNTLSRLVITFLPRASVFFISWLQSPSVVILDPKKIKSATVSIVSPSICHEVIGLNIWSSFFECWVLRHPPLSLSSRGSLILWFLPQEWYHLHIWGYWYFSQHSWFQLGLLQSGILHDVLCI